MAQRARIFLDNRLDQVRWVVVEFHRVQLTLVGDLLQHPALQPGRSTWSAGLLQSTLFGCEAFGNERSQCQGTQDRDATDNTPCTHPAMFPSGRILLDQPWYVGGLADDRDGAAWLPAVQYLGPQLLLAARMREYEADAVRLQLLDLIGSCSGLADAVVRWASELAQVCDHQRLRRRQADVAPRCAPVHR